jgi:hypothetical protein
VIRLLHWIQHEWDPANGKEDNCSHKDTNPRNSAWVGDGLGSDMLLRAPRAHSQLSWFSAPINNERGMVRLRPVVVPDVGVGMIIAVGVLIHNHGNSMAVSDRKARDVGLGHLNG